MPMRLRSSRISTGDTVARSRPNRITLPLSARSRPIISFSRTDLPEPLRPMITVVMPGRYLQVEPAQHRLVPESDRDVDELETGLSGSTATALAREPAGCAVMEERVSPT